MESSTCQFVTLYTNVIHTTTTKFLKAKNILTTATYFISFYLEIYRLYSTYLPQSTVCSHATPVLCWAEISSEVQTYIRLGLHFKQVYIIVILDKHKYCILFSGDVFAHKKKVYPYHSLLFLLALSTNTVRKSTIFFLNFSHVWQIQVSFK